MQACHSNSNTAYWNGLQVCLLWRIAYIMLQKELHLQMQRPGKCVSPGEELESLVRTTTTSKAEICGLHMCLPRHLPRRFPTLQEDLQCSEQEPQRDVDTVPLDLGQRQRAPS